VQGLGPVRPLSGGGITASAVLLIACQVCVDLAKRIPVINQSLIAWLQDGATIACNQSTCNVTFHPLCARNAGCYLAIRQSAGKAVYRCYCLNHSESQRRKDLFGTEVRAACGSWSDTVCSIFEAAYS